MRTASYTATATYHSGYVQGSFGKKADVFNCSNVASAPVNYYVRAYDYGTSTWSNQLAVKVCTNVL